MKNNILLIALFIAVQFNLIAQDTPVKLHECEVFLMAEYEKIGYSKVDYSGDRNESHATIPNYLSYQSFHMLMDPSHIGNRIVDLNYLYLENYSSSENSGNLYYFASEKAAPRNKHSLTKENDIQRYFELSTLAVHVDFGYWKKYKIEGDESKEYIMLMIRKKSKVKNMDDFHVWSGELGLNGEIYLTHSMNTEDDFLFSKKFRKILDKNIYLSLPIKLSKVFAEDSIQLTDNNYKKVAVKFWKKKYFDELYWDHRDALRESDGYDYHRYENTSLTSQFSEFTLTPIEYKGLKKLFRKPGVRLKSTDPLGNIDHVILKIPGRKNYFRLNTSTRQMFIHIENPYSTGRTRYIMFEVPLPE
jgi:hypothetical protein